MTFNFDLLWQSILNGKWFLSPVILLSIGLSAGFSAFILSQLRDLRFISVHSRFFTDSPETIFEQAWMDYLRALTFLYRLTIRLLLLLIGFSGTLLLCSVVVNVLAGESIVHIPGAPEDNHWMTLALTGAIPMFISWAISDIINAKGRRIPEGFPTRGEKAQ
jgi:hypothetical protein